MCEILKPASFLRSGQYGCVEPTFLQVEKGKGGKGGMGEGDGGRG